MGYAYKILHNSVDITEKITGFSISCYKDNYCREMTFDTPDIDFYNTFDFTSLATAPSIEIQTKIGDTWYSQGTFYIEKPAYTINIDEDIVRGVWGRSGAAILGAPFATKITKTWDTNTTFFTICEEMCDVMGYSWDSAYSEVADFPVFKYTYQVDKLYPIDVISELSMLAGAYVTTDRLGNICIKEIDFSPTSEDVTITDDTILSIDENPEFPEFGNRIRVTPSGSLAGYQVTVLSPDPCLNPDGTSTKSVYAFVVDSEGTAIQDIIVDWSIDATSATLLAATSNTQEIFFSNEIQNATNSYTITVNYPVYSVSGIYAYSDKTKSNNFAAAGYSIDNNTITCDNSFTYCDQSLVIDYSCRGVAVNRVISGTVQEDVEVTASVEGQDDTTNFYIGNSCQCAATIDLSAASNSININESTTLLIYCEEGGPITDGRKIYISIINQVKAGMLSFLHKNLTTVTITDIKTKAYNAIAGITQCDVPHYIAAVTSVFEVDDEGGPTGDNLYSYFSGKTIDLSAIIEAGTDLLVSYSIYGAAVATYYGKTGGSDRIKAWVRTNKEEQISDEEIIQVVDPGGVTNDSPPDANDDGLKICNEVTCDEGEVCCEPCGGNVCPEGEVCCVVPGGTACVPTGNCSSPATESGCLAEENCVDQSPSPALPPWEPGVTDCYGTVCAEGQSCCFSGGVIGCYAPDLCDQSSDPCYPDDVSGNPTAEALASRFDDAKNLGCTCEQLCQNEFDTYGTNQGSNNYVALDPESASYEEDRAASLAACVATCDCSAELEMAGPETMAQSDSDTVSISNGKAPFIWSVSGTGFSIDADSGTSVGVTTSATACGTGTVTVTDDCGNTASWSIRCTAGKWTALPTGVCYIPGDAGDYVGFTLTKISGKYKQTQYRSVVGGTSYSGPDMAGCLSEQARLLALRSGDCLAGSCDTTYGCTGCLTPVCTGDCLTPSVEVTARCNQYGGYWGEFRIWCAWGLSAWEWTC